MRYAAPRPAAARRARLERLRLAGAQHEVRRRPVRALPVRPVLRLQGRPGLPLRPDRGRFFGMREAVRWPRPKLAVFKFASCDGCQLIAARLRGRAARAWPARSRSRTSSRPRARSPKGPYDLTLVEGSITTAHDAERIQQVREQSRVLVTIGACATAGGIQALRNFADVERVHRAPSTRHPSTSRRSTTSTPIVAARARRLRAARLPDRQAASSSRCWAPSCAGGSPNIPSYQRVPRVQAARQRVRDGGPRHAVPRAR